MAECGERLGRRIHPGAVAIAFWGAGWAANNQEIASTGEVLAEAEILNGIYTTLFKSIVGRERPDHSGADSFPSGHSSDSFCFAAVIDSRLGHGWGIPAYSLAVLTAMSRMDSDKHYLSDVVMGAGLGMIVGYSVSKNHDDWPYSKRWHFTDKNRELDKISFMPLTSPHFHDGLGFGDLFAARIQPTILSRIIRPQPNPHEKKSVPRLMPGHAF